jgi:hypothetical protein
MRHDPQLRDYYSEQKNIVAGEGGGIVVLLVMILAVLCFGLVKFVKYMFF